MTLDMESGQAKSCKKKGYRVLSGGSGREWKNTAASESQNKTLLNQWGRRRDTITIVFKFNHLKGFSYITDD